MFMAIGAALGAVIGGTVATTAGVLSTAGAIGALAGASIGGQVDAGIKAADYASESAELNQEFIDKKFGYDNELRNMQKDKILADREQAVKVIQTEAANEDKRADWQDVTNLQTYAHQVQIRQRQQDSLDAQFSKSTDIYNRQISLNELSAKSATEDEYRSIEELEAEQRYNQQEEWIKFIEREGEMRARMGTGRTATKGSQINYFQLGQSMAAINAAMSGARMGSLSALQEIGLDREAADIAAEAQRMLDPGTLPETPLPILTPRADFLYPRALGEYDFGPQPIKGVAMSPSSAANQAWGNAISGIAGTVGSLAGGAIAKIA